MADMDEGGPGTQPHDQTAEDRGVSRREAIRETAVNAALIALFGGALSFETVMAQAMGRVSDVEGARRVGADAADRVGQGGQRGPLGATCAVGTLFTCNPRYECGTTGDYTFGCTIRDFTCQTTFLCATDPAGEFNCTEEHFQCTEFTCPPSRFHCSDYEA